MDTHSNLSLTELQQSHRIIFETTAGSHAYGTNIPTSDTDTRGLFWVPRADFLALTEPPGQIGDDKSDTVYYAVRRFFELAMNANPNILELLWMPDDCQRISTPAFEHLKAHRDLFITKKCFHSFNGYAFAQIKKARGQNKLVHNPEPVEKPTQLDFCHVISRKAEERALVRSRPMTYRDAQAAGDVYPLAEYHVSSVEHTSNVYRMYYYGQDAKGVFRGDGNLVCESIPIEDESWRYAGQLIYSPHEYDQALKRWHQYWDWMKVRNPDRWETQGAGKMDWDCYLDSETSFLTHRGWVKYDEVTDSDEIGTVNPDTHVFEWQHPTARRADTYNGTIHSYENRYTRFSVTPNHRIYVSDAHRKPSNNYTTRFDPDNANWHFTTVEQYMQERKHHKHILTACDNASPDYTGVTDDLLKLSGLYISEGSIDYSKSGVPRAVSISQLEGGRACPVMDSTSYKFSVTRKLRKGRTELTCNINDKVLAAWMHTMFGAGSHNKKLPAELYTKLSTRQLNLLFDSLMSGDGHYHAKGHSVYYTTSKQLATDLHTALVTHGVAAQMYGPYGPYAVNAAASYQVFVPRTSKNTVAFNKYAQSAPGKAGWSTMTVQDGRIVCFTVTNGLLLTRSGSKIAIQGNCKNIMHCVRLLMSGTHILEHGTPLVRMEGADLQYLRDVRAGLLSYEDVMADVEVRMAAFEALAAVSTLPWGVNHKKMERLYRELQEIVEPKG
jgi:hypothetical protein